jgi:hypothetical protein
MIYGGSVPPRTLLRTAHAEIDIRRWPTVEDVKDLVVRRKQGHHTADRALHGCLPDQTESLLVVPAFAGVARFLKWLDYTHE